MYLELCAGKRQLICFVGGGGKSSLMAMLAEDAVRDGRTVLVTTTTKMLCRQLMDLGPLVMDRNPDTMMTDLTMTVHHCPLVTAAADVTSAHSNENDQVIGLSPEVVTDIYQQGLFELVFVEADGAKGLPFKAPAGHEPVIPSAATIVCPVVGIDSLGHPLSERFVHRAELVAQITGQAMDTEVNAGTITDVFSYYKTLMTKLSPDIELLPIINKVDDSALREKAQPLVDALHGAGFRRVILTSTANAPPTI